MVAAAAEDDDDKTDDNDGDVVNSSHIVVDVGHDPSPPRHRSTCYCHQRHY